MATNFTVTEIRNEAFVNEAEVTIPVDDVEAAKNAFAVIAKLRKQAIDALEVDENTEEGEALLAVDYRIEDDKVIVHVTQGIVD